MIRRLGREGNELQTQAPRLGTVAAMSKIGRWRYRQSP
jgi:hypothetical protein